VHWSRSALCHHRRPGSNAEPFLSEGTPVDFKHGRRRVGGHSDGLGDVRCRPSHLPDDSQPSDSAGWQLARIIQSSRAASYREATGRNMTNTRDQELEGHGTSARQKMTDARDHPGTPRSRPRAKEHGHDQHHGRAVRLRSWARGNEGMASGERARATDRNTLADGVSSSRNCSSTTMRFGLGLT
jgi:hypothetical protein